VSAIDSSEARPSRAGTPSPRATPSRVLIVTTGGGDAPTGWIERLAAAWPETDSLPDLELWSSDELDAGLPNRPRLGATLEDAGVVVLVGGGEAEVARLADRIEAHAVPAVFVARDAAAAGRSARRAMLARRGIPAISGEDDAERSAAMLHAIARRQPLVSRLIAESRVAQRQLAGALGELEKVEGELREAARVQQNFAHRRMPTIDGLDIGTIYRPAGHVSGDVFDVEVLDDHRIGFFLADAAGHGVPAAMLTLFISRALVKVERSGDRPRVVPPGEALARLNHDFAARGGPTDRFATAVYGVYNTKTREARIAGAGHPPPIVAGPDAPTERVETDGPLLGVFPDATFTEAVVSLPPGRSLMLFSDGWEVAFPPDDADAHTLRLPTQTYLDRLERLGVECARDGVGNAVADLTGVLDHQAGSLHQPDDVTALILTGVPTANTSAA